MTTTEREIFSQHEALAKTLDWFQRKGEAAAAFLTGGPEKKLVFMGCGSSYMLAKSAECLFLSPRFPTSKALAGGDYLVCPEAYAGLVQDSVVVLLSRSGMTSELVLAAQHIRAQTNARILVVTMLADNQLSPQAGFTISLPWAYDESVCQTRTVTNLYAALLLLKAAAFHEPALAADMGRLAGRQAGLLEAYAPVARALGGQRFDNVVVLADGELCGIAEEGALAFTEIALVSGKYFHLLDYRHGPKVLNGANTLNIVALRPGEARFQLDMVADLKAMGGKLVVLDTVEADRFGADAHLFMPTDNFACCGIPLINLCQILALETAKAREVDPDSPNGLDAYIRLR